jgi:hypothetical protein
MTPLIPKAGVALSSAALVGILLSGCNASSAAQFELPQQNRAEWVLPLDAYTITATDAEIVFHAWVLASVECARLEGVVSLTAPSRPDTAQSELPSWNAVGRKLFDERLAAQYGYHNSPDLAAKPDDEWNSLRDAALSSADQEKLNACQTQAYEELPGAQVDANVVSSFEWNAAAEVDQDDQVIASAERWNECMTPLGIPDLPAAPSAMPTASQAERFGFDGEKALGLTPAADEVDQAVADARCRESSGYSEAYYLAEWDAQVAVLDKNKEELRRAHEGIVTAIDDARTFIGEHAPSAE